MQKIENFGQAVEALAKRDTRKKIAIIWPQDPATRAAVAMALDAGIIDAVFVGCRAEVEADQSIMAHAGRISFADAADSDQAAAMAVGMARDGQVDALMKGLLNTDNLLRAVLNKEHGILPPGSTLTHLTITQIPSLPRLLMFTDAAVIPYPTAAQRQVQVRLCAGMGRRLGVAEPRIALIHCTEKVDARHFPFTESYPVLRAQAEAGEFGPCIVDGPFDVKCACSPAAMAKKGLTSPIGGMADALVFPDIEAANTFYKTITLFAGASTAGLLAGLSVPVVLPSRGDSPQSKFYSLAMASL